MTDGMPALVRTEMEWKSAFIVTTICPATDRLGQNIRIGCRRHAQLPNVSRLETDLNQQIDSGSRQPLVKW